jgi:polyisoprenoid-binding protein YceI
MSKRARITIIAVVAAVFLAGGAYAAFALLAVGSSPAPVSISPAGDGDLSIDDGSGGGGSPLTQAEFQGRWTVDTNGSFVGYRVREQLGILPAPSDAVGRTSAVSGGLAIDGLSVSSLDVTADLTQLQSDRSMRDGRMRTIGLQTDQFPSATFELTSPVTLSKVPAPGEVITVTAHGKLTLHGVTKDVTVQVKGTLVNGRIELVGSLPIVFADYGIDPPNVGGFVTVQDHGTMEFKLFLAKA